jgi:eukaryotic-like serine/threonine-protein kinase
MSLSAVNSKSPILAISLAILIYSVWLSVVEADHMNTLAQPTGDNENANFKTFENNIFGIRMLYPSDWSVTEVKSTLSPNSSISAVAFFKAPIIGPSDPYQENVIINMKGPSPDALTLNDYTANTLETFGNMPTIRLLQSFPNTLSGLPAHMIVYSENSQGIDLQKMQIWTIVNNTTAYVVTFGAEQAQFWRYLPAVESMVSSIQINKPATTTTAGIAR